MSRTINLATLATALLLTGCSSNYLSKIDHPYRINETETINAGTAEQQAFLMKYRTPYTPDGDADTDGIVVQTFLNSLIAAKDVKDTKSTDDKNKLLEYTKNGIALVNCYCTRWFELVEYKKRRLDYYESQMNTGYNLATTLLGLTNPSGDLVAGLAGGKLAADSFADNLEAGYLLAPSTYKVKQKIEEIMGQVAKQMTDAVDSKETSKRISDFPTMKSYLKKYADLCSNSAAKDILDNGLDKTITVTAPSSTSGPINTNYTIK